MRNCVLLKLKQYLVITGFVQTMTFKNQRLFIQRPFKDQGYIKRIVTFSD